MTIDSIAHFHDSYALTANGISTALTDLAVAQVGLGHRPFIISGSDETRNYFRDGVEISLFRGIPVDFLYKGYFINTISLNKLLNHCRERNAELVHVHLESTNGFNGLYVQKVLKIPCVSTFHTFWDQYNAYVSGKTLEPLLRAPIRAYLWAHMRYFHSHADAIIAPSKYVKTELEKRGFEKVHYVPGGVNTEKFLPMSTEKKERFRKRFGIPEGKRVLLYLGRIGFEKNIQLLFETIKSSENSVLVIGGRGPAEEFLRKRASNLGVLEKTIFAGYLGDSELSGFYNCADVFALPSRTETQGLVVLEAMASGVPVVVFEGATSELVSDKSSGLVAKTCSGFIENVLRLLSDSRLSRKMGAIARKVAEKNDKRKTARMTDSAYRKAAKEFRETHVGRRDVLASMIRKMKGYGSLKKYYEMEWLPTQKK